MTVVVDSEQVDWLKGLGSGQLCKCTSALADSKNEDSFITVHVLLADSENEDSFITVQVILQTPRTKIAL